MLNEIYAQGAGSGGGGTAGGRADTAPGNANRRAGTPYSGFGLNPRRVGQPTRRNR